MRRKPLAKDGGSHSDGRCSALDGGLIIPAHPHAALGQVVSISEAVQRGEIGHWVQFLGRDAHQPVNCQTIFITALP